jgi:hypothetical protein
LVIKNFAWNKTDFGLEQLDKGSFGSRSDCSGQSMAYCKIESIAFEGDQRWYNDGSGGYLSAPNSTLLVFSGCQTLRQYDFSLIL